MTDIRSARPDLMRALIVSAGKSGTSGSPDGTGVGSRQPPGALRVDGVLIGVGRL